jgi:hypothetical protein
MRTFKEWVRAEYDNDELRDIAKHGANSGFHGMTYYNETRALFDKYEDCIEEEYSEFVESAGEEYLGFYLKGCESVYRIKNQMVWIVAEILAERILGEEE